MKLYSKIFGVLVSAVALVALPGCTDYLPKWCKMCGVSEEAPAKPTAATESEMPETPTDVAPMIKTISAETLRDEIDETEDLIVINVLAAEYYDDCHIKGSVNIPLAELEKESKEWPKDKPIVVYCASKTCPASAQAARLLMKLGFSKVRAYEGGVREWMVEKGFEAAGACQKDYLKE